MINFRYHLASLIAVFLALGLGIVAGSTFVSPETVRAGIEELAAQYGAEEVIVVTITHDPVARRHSYELLADAFGLESNPSDALAGLRG